jgi:hypothetical protein
MLDYIRHGKPHSPMQDNPTHMPSTFLATLRLIFLIRHPALLIPSNYRAMKDIAALETKDEDFLAISTLRWSRWLWEYFAAHPPVQPPVLIDAEDTLADPEPLISKLCGLIGIDAKDVEYTWDAVPKELWPTKEQDPLGITVTTVGGVFKSSGVVRTGAKKKAVDIDAEEQRWKEEFGPDLAQAFRARVDTAMEDYEYLRQFRLVP